VAVIDFLLAAITITALLAAAWALLLLVADRRLGLALFGLLAVLEFALLVQAVAGVVQLLGTDRAVERLSFVGYLVGSLLILPIATVVALAERSRWAGGVLLVRCLTIPVMVLRLQQIWAGTGA
jgi:hypothetical protein